MKDYIKKAIEGSWDRDDEGEYILPTERKWLEAKGALVEWEEAYFDHLVESYRGTCNSIGPKDESFLEDFDRYQDLDNEIFNCGTCGWWYDSSEEGESLNWERTCSECSADEEE